MYIKKSVLCAAILIPGAFILILVFILFSFSDAAIPYPFYSSVWFGVLALMIRLLSAVSEERGR